MGLIKPLNIVSGVEEHRIVRQLVLPKQHSTFVELCAPEPRKLHYLCTILT